MNKNISFYLVLILCIGISIPARAALSGTYTVNPSQPASKTNYQNIKSVTTDLCNGYRFDGGKPNGMGVSGPVIIKIADGTYFEQLYMTTVKGASVKNTVTFQSSSNDSSKVILLFASASGVYSQNYSLYLDSTAFVNFKQLTFSTTGFVSENILKLTLVNNVQFLNNVIRGNSGSTLASITNNGPNLVFKNNHFINGSYCINATGNSSKAGEKLDIENNVIDSFYTEGIYLTLEDSFTIAHNKIINGIGVVPGMEIYNCYNWFKVDANYFTSSILLHNIGTITGTAAIFSNNMVSVNLPAGSYLYGMSLDLFMRVIFVNNSVLLYGGNSTGSTTFSVGTAANTKYGAALWYNNNFLNNTGGYAIYGSSLGANDTFDFNNYYTTGGYIGYKNGTSEKLLSNWKSGSGKDGNAISVIPLFKSNFDLHAYSPALRVGSYNALAKYDYDGILRNNSTVCIGVNEFMSVKDDIGIYAIDSPSSPFCSGTYNIYARLVNFGRDTIKTATVNWSINGSKQSSYSWTGILDTGKISSLIKLGTCTFNSNTPVAIKEWSSGPNGKSDNQTKNDTLKVTTTASLSGTYTIGGSNPDFPGFNAAIQVLQQRGVCGPVVFNIRNGVYNEQLLIDSIPGTGPNSTVTFQSESGDSSAVVLRWASTNDLNSQNYTISFVRLAQYVTFKGITICRTGDNALRRVIIMDDYTKHNTITNCIIRNIPNSYIYNQLIVGGGVNLTIKNNYLIGGYNAIDLYTGSNTGHTTITGNRIDSFYLNGIYEKYYDSLIVNNNTITNNLGRNGYGIYFNLASSTGYNYYYNVSGNRISLPSGGTGIYGYGQYGVMALISNNFISVKNVSAINCGLNTMSNTYLYNNNVLIYGDTLNTSACIYTTKNSGLGLDTIFNNNFTNTAKGYTIYAPSAGRNLIDYNNYFTNGKILANYNSTTAVNLAALKTADAMDKHSVTADPVYTSATDLHVHSAAINGAAKPLNVVKTDIDGDKRDGTNPDIGADEFTPYKEDVTLASIDSPTTPFCSGSSNVVIYIKNLGTDTLKSLSIGWSINGVSQSSNTWTGKLPQGAYTKINLGAFNFKANTIYNVKSWTYSPNGTVDSNTQNDTLVVTNSPAMNGSYSIGGSSPDFQTFNAAVNALNSRGVCGTVTFNVANGIYREAIKMHTIPGVSSTNTVTFQSASNDNTKVTLENPGTNKEVYVLRFDSVSWVSFKNISLEGTGTNDSSVIKIVNSANLDFEGNRIIGSNSSVNIIDCISQPCDSFLTFKGNNIANGLYGFNYTGRALNTKGWVSLINNTFENLGTAAIYLQYIDSVAIIGNLIHNFASAGGLGVYINNYIQVSSTARIEGNRIYFGSGTGLTFYDLTGRSNSHVRINNNFISGYNSFGIFNTTLDTFYDFCDNNVLVYGYNPNSTCLYFGFGLSKKGPGVYFTGNNLVNMAAGTAINIGGTKVMISQNNNNYYTNGSVLATLGGVNISDLATWQSFTKVDTNTISVNPFYLSNDDLHVGNTALYQKGRSISYIKTDIDGRIRSTTKPTIGAHEFHPVNNDAGISAIDSPYQSYCGSGAYIKVTLYNYGISNLKSAKIQWQINGVSQKTYSWTGNLVTSGTDTVNLGYITFSSSKNNSIKAWIELPNGIKDGDSTNDTSMVSNLASALGGSYTIGGKSPDYLSFNAAITDLNLYGICGPVVFNVRDGSYNEHINIGAVKGASPKNTITFQSESGDSSKVILFSPALNSFPYDTATVLLKGARYVIINEITMQRTATLAPYNAALVLQFSGSSSYNTIRHCRFIGLVANSQTYSIISQHDNNCNDNLIDQNYFKNGYDGIIWYPSNSDSENVFSNNIFDSIFGNAIFAQGTIGLTISGNRIGNFSNTTNLAGTGINMRECINTRQISGNKINVNVGWTCLYMWGCSGKPSRKALISNNYFSSAGKFDYYYGGGAMTIEFSSFIDVISNSLIYYGTDTTWAAVDFIGNDNTPKSINIIDNTCVNTGNGPLIEISSSNTLPTSYNSIDYNNWYASPNAHYFAIYTNKKYTKLADWKKITGKDTSSVSVLPGYASNTNLDLVNYNLFQLGKPYKLVKTDIYGNSRDTLKPTIGAFEIPVLKNDIGVKALLAPNKAICGDSFAILTVKFQNFGSETQTRIPMVIDVTGAANLTLKDTAKGNFVQGSIDSFSFKTRLNTYSGGLYHFSVYAALPGDQFHYNDTAFASVLFYKHAVPNFNANSALCPLDTVYFKDSSTVTAEDTIIAWLWNTGDGNAGNLQNIQHLYSLPGTYSASLKVTTEKGCTSSVKKPILVSQPPVAGFDFVSKCYDDSIHFEDSSIVYSGIPSYQWDFGDGASSILKSPHHKYIKPGKYIVKHIVISKGACIDTVSRFVIVKGATVAFHVNPFQCQGSTTVFTDSSSINNGDSIVSYIWKFGDTSSSVLQSPSHIYTSTGNYNVYLVILTKAGCKDSSGKILTISQSPKAGFSTSDLCFGDSADFVNKTIFSAGNHTSKWDFGDNSFSNINSPRHKYKAPTGYHVKLLVKTNIGCADSFASDITIKPLPDARWLATYSGQAAYLHAIDSSFNDTSYHWKLGDANTATGHLVKHTYLNRGKYTISLLVSGPNGCDNQFDSTINAAGSGINSTNEENFSLEIYPNPFSTSATVQYSLTEKSNVQIRLFDITGKQMTFIANKSELPGTYKVEINAEKYHLKPGIYLLQFETDKGQISMHIVKL